MRQDSTGKPGIGSNCQNTSMKPIVYNEKNTVIQECTLTNMIMAQLFFEKNVNITI